MEYIPKAVKKKRPRKNRMPGLREQVALATTKALAWETAYICAVRNLRTVEEMYEVLSVRYNALLRKRKLIVTERAIQRTRIDAADAIRTARIEKTK
jgi:hypothetical protein